MIMTLMYVFDLIVLKKRVDNEEIVSKLQFVDDLGYIQDVYTALSEKCWTPNGLRSICLFSFPLSIATLRQTPQNSQQNIKFISVNEIKINFLSEIEL